ncbi:MAG: NUDIX domain-containing protein [Saprospiraceae bacterium]|nr:NUDIX domain-containing protein [Saprospiraceae bacterium]MCB9309777.1 NUDIX domain-containing protein [Lewinellaceae bacterium]
MYKIHINEAEVILKASENIDIVDMTIPRSLFMAYDGNPKFLLNVIYSLERTLKVDKVIIHYSDYEKLKADFLSHFTIIEAGGGLVRNELGEYLFIFRRGSWDLPKGKIEPKETKKEATLREIEEETGIKRMVILYKLGITRHTYRSNVGKRIIKKSHWYLIETKKQTPKPQTSEDIEKAVWMTLENFLSKKRKVYPNILDVIHTQDTVGIDSKVRIKIK